MLDLLEVLKKASGAGVAEAGTMEGDRSERKGSPHCGWQVSLDEMQNH